MHSTQLGGMATEAGALRREPTITPTTMARRHVDRMYRGSERKAEDGLSGKLYVMTYCFRTLNWPSGSEITRSGR